MLTTLQLAEHIEGINGIDLRRIGLDDLKDRVALMFHGGNRHNLEINQTFTWFRGRKCGEADFYENISEVIYPKPENCKIGRANRPGSPVLYASNFIGTALCELAAEKDDYFAFIKIKTKENVVCSSTIIGEDEHIFKSGWSSLIGDPNSVKAARAYFASHGPDHTNRTVIIDAFIAQRFSVRVVNDYEYKFTIAIAERLMETYDSIIYPSVENRGGLNVVISKSAFDSKFEILSIEKHKIVENYGFGLYGGKRIATAKIKDKNGALEWTKV